MRRAWCLILLPLLASTRLLAAGGAIVGRVTVAGDAEAGPLVGASVYLSGTVRGTTTNASGEFRMAGIPAGTYTLVFSMVGYHRETMPDIRVEESKETLVNVALRQSPIQTEQVVVTASKREQSLAEVPLSMSIMDSKELEQRNSLVIDDALRYISGVNMTGFQVNIRGSSGYSRGAGSRVLMLVDGIPFITGDTGELNFESIPVGQVDRIEVVKGASSALYGSNALGGVINVITKPIPETAETIVRTYGALYNEPSYDQWKWADNARFTNGQSISHARKVGDLGVSLFFSRQFDDGYRQNDYRRRYNFYMKVREDFSAANSLTLNFSMLYQYGGQFVYWRNLDSALIPPYLQQTDNVKSMRYFVSGLYNDALADNFLLTTKFIWYHNDWGYETIRGIGRTESIADDLRAEVLSTILLDQVHTLTAGVEGNFDIIGADIFGNRKIGGLALYAQDEMRFSEAFSLTVGARYDYQSLGLVEPGGQLNPKAAIAYRPGPGTSLRASFGRGYRVPSVAEAFITAGVSNLTVVPNENLKPERSYSYEIGISQMLGGFGSFDFAGFSSDYDNLIEAGLFASGQDLMIQWRNVTKARVQGVETSLKLGFFDGNLTYTLGYTYVYPEDLTENDLLKYRPRHLFYTSARGQLGWLSAQADFRYISRVDRVDEELVDYGIVPDGDARVAIFVTDFRLGADFFLGSLPLNVTLNLNNAFQYNYVELIGNLMPPRTYVIVLEARL
jgi:outer membrane receptor for ferrienterochelin and colicins